MATKKAAEPRRLAGMTVGKQKPKPPAGIGDVREAEHREMVREREEARKKRARSEARKEQLAKKGGQIA